MRKLSWKVIAELTACDEANLALKLASVSLTTARLITSEASRMQLYLYLEVDQPPGVLPSREEATVVPGSALDISGGLVASFI